MITRNLFATAVLATVLIAVAPPAWAQLPPSPSDAPPGERPGVRPTPAPRTPPPPPPDVAPRPAPRRDRVAPSPPVVPPPPPPEVTPVSPPPAPARPADKVFGTRGVFELGGSFAFSAYRDFVSNSTWLTLGLDAYAGYFITKYFTMGLYMAVYFEQNRFGGDSSWIVEPVFLLAPGVAIPLTRRTFLYADLLGGIFARKKLESGIQPSRIKDVRGAVGAELGVKLRVAKRLLLRLGVRPIYFAGKRTGEDDLGSVDGKIGLFEFMFRVGFSGFL